MSTTSPMSGREQRDAAGHLDRGPRDVAGLLAAKEAYCGGDVRRLAEALEYGPVLEALVEGVGLSTHPACLGEDDAGHDRVGRYVVPAALQRGRPGQPDDSSLARRVAGLTEATQRARHRRHEDDPAPPLFDHIWPDLLRTVEGPGEVYGDVAVPQPVVLVGDLGCVVEGGRVVDQDVDAAELPSHLRQHLADLVAVGHVHLDGGGAPAH